MRETLKNYMYRNDSFELFTAQHIIGILIFFFLMVGLPLFAVKKLSSKRQQQVGTVLGWTVAGSYISWVILEIGAGTFDIKSHLPLHLCRTANLLLPFIMIKRHYRIFEILYFWSLSGMLQAVFTPDITHSFPHFHFFRFWLAHNGLILAIIYATVVYKMKPTIGSLWRAFFALNMYLFVAVVVNILLGSNYFWISGKPPTKSLLDYMGPWPWYILSGEFVALIHFFAAYAPIHFLYKIKLRRSNLSNPTVSID